MAVDHAAKLALVELGRRGRVSKRRGEVCIGGSERAPAVAVCAVRGVVCLLVGAAAVEHHAAAAAPLRACCKARRRSAHPLAIAQCWV